jgi:hypothetical protein
VNDSEIAAKFCNSLTQSQPETARAHLISIAEEKISHKDFGKVEILLQVLRVPKTNKHNFDVIMKC